MRDSKNCEEGTTCHGIGISGRGSRGSPPGIIKLEGCLDQGGLQESESYQRYIRGVHQQAGAYDIVVC